MMMSLSPPSPIRPAPQGCLISALVAAEGTAAHPYTTSHDLLASKHSARNLADVVHFLTALHGRHPGVADLAAVHSVQDEARGWLIDAVDGFIRERSYLTKLVVAVGPLPSTPGQAQSESAVNGQRHALEMLAQSDRAGCALGAALALVQDWSAIRDVVERAAERFGVDVPDSHLPSASHSADVARALSGNPAIERAMSFGAQQILAQHRGLWDLLEARQVARGDY
jgi:hypothetical protein